LRKHSIKEELIEDEITYKVGNSGSQSLKHESSKPVKPNGKSNDLNDVMEA